MLGLLAEQGERQSLWGKLRRVLRPRGPQFFDLFDLHASLCVEGLRLLVELLRNVENPNGRVRDIEAIEKRADGVVDEMRNLLGNVSWPPMSRVAAYELINGLDDILDVVEDGAQSLHLYHVTQITGEAIKLAELALAASEKLQRAVAQLRDMQNPGATLALCAEVDQLEAQADHVMRAAMSKLFREEPDTRQLVKLKAIYELLEELTDKCKDAATHVEAVVLKYG